jgi:hypothetical protein
MDILQQLNQGYIRSVQSSDVRWFEEHLARLTSPAVLRAS